MRHSFWIISLVCASATLLPCFGQGGDECVGATVISGTGTFPFDQTLGSQSSDGSICGTLGIDVWFAWTPSQSATHILTTCGGASHDTKIAVYDGCGGVELACNDDNCGVQSQLSFSAVVGSTYMLRIGTYNTVPGNVGTFDIIADLPILNPNNGHYYKQIDVSTDWQSAKIAAEGMLFNNFPGHLVTITDQAEFDWIINNLTISRPWIGLYQDTTSPTYSEPNGGWTWVTGEPYSFNNWAVGEPNDISGSGGHEDYIEMYGSGEWNDAELNHTGTLAYLVEWDGAGIGVAFCDPMNINSTGQSTQLTVNSSTVSPTGVHLEATQGPPGTFGYFLVGMGVNDPGIPVSQGRLCFSTTGGNTFAGYKIGTSSLNSIGRFDAAGVMQNLPGSSSTGTGFDVPSTLPFAGAPVITAGQTWHFQVWHREAGGLSNFSNGMSVTF